MVPAAVSLAASPVGMLAVARLGEQRWLVPREQFVSFIWGDQALAAAAWTGAIVMRRSEPPPRVFRTMGWPYVCAVAGAAAGIVAWRADAAAKVGRGAGDELVYTDGQLVSPTKVWHNVIAYAPIAMVLGAVSIPALFAKPTLPADRWQPALRVFGGFSLAFWAVAALWWDPKHPKPAAHVDLHRDDASELVKILRLRPAEPTM